MPKLLTQTYREADDIGLCIHKLALAMCQPPLDTDSKGQELCHASFQCQHCMSGLQGSQSPGPPKWVDYLKPGIDDECLQALSVGSPNLMGSQ